MSKGSKKAGRRPPAARSKGEAAFALQLRALKFPQWEEEYRFHPRRRWRFDFAWPEHKLAVEVEGVTGGAGGRHQRREGFIEDLDKYSEAWRLGWKVLRIDSGMISNLKAVRLIAPHLGLNLDRDR